MFKKFVMVKKYLKNLVKQMSLEDGRYMVGIMQVGDSAEPQMHVKFSKDLTQKKLQHKIDMLRPEGRRNNFNIAGYRQAGYEVNIISFFHKNT